MLDDPEPVQAVISTDSEPIQAVIFTVPNATMHTVTQVIQGWIW
jgi:hypothetical protein